MAKQKTTSLALRSDKNSSLWSADTSTGFNTVLDHIREKSDNVRLVVPPDTRRLIIVINHPNCIFQEQQMRAAAAAAENAQTLKRKVQMDSAAFEGR